LLNVNVVTEAVSSSELQAPKHRRWHEPQRRLEVYVAPEYLRYSKLTEKLRTLERVLGNIPRVLGSFAEDRINPALTPARPCESSFLALHTAAMAEEPRAMLPHNG
jgi:hypothetical protein